MAVVKANAYGHGLHLVAPALYRCGCRAFAVTDAEEGIRLRAILAEDAHIVLLSGLFEFQDAVHAQHHQLTPIITEPKHIQWLNDASFRGKVWIKVDTGMQRLGATAPLPLLRQCQQVNIGLAGIMSHLACADTPEHPLNQTQADDFSRLCATLQTHRDTELPASLLNSAGLIALPNQTLHAIRPGIALYGVEPVAGKPLGLKPVMEMTAQVMQVRQINKGSPVSYGASFTAPKDMSVALICAGYADGIPRQLSNQGVVMSEGLQYAIIGRVCMDYCLLDCTENPLQCGQTVSFWGTDTLRVEDVAHQINTIAYTLLASIPTRVQRMIRQAKLVRTG